MSRLRDPSPNLGECRETGTWSNPEMIQQCNKCVEQEDMFFCGDRCLSRYSFDTCNLNELIAKNKFQCVTPCRQEGVPVIGGGCTDKFDCMEGQYCEIKNVPVYDGNQLRGSEKRGVCVDRVAQGLHTLKPRLNNNNVPNTMFMGVL